MILGHFEPRFPLVQMCLYPYYYSRNYPSVHCVPLCFVVLDNLDCIHWNLDLTKFPNFLTFSTPSSIKCQTSFFGCVPPGQPVIPSGWVRPPVSSHMESWCCCFICYSVWSPFMLVFGLGHASYGHTPNLSWAPGRDGLSQPPGSRDWATEHQVSQAATRIQLGLKSEVSFIVLTIIKDALLCKLSTSWYQYH